MVLRQFSVGHSSHWMQMPQNKARNLKVLKPVFLEHTFARGFQALKERNSVISCVFTRETVIPWELTMVTMLQIPQQQICSSSWLACDCWERETLLSIKSSYFGTWIKYPKGRELIWMTGIISYWLSWMLCTLITGNPLHRMNYYNFLELLSITHLSFQIQGFKLLLDNFSFDFLCAFILPADLVFSTSTASQIIGSVMLFDISDAFTDKGILPVLRWCWLYICCDNCKVLSGLLDAC